MTGYPKVVEIVVSYLDLGEGEGWIDADLAKAQIEDFVLEPLRRVGIPVLVTEEVEGDEAQTIITTLDSNPVISAENWEEVGDRWEENPKTQGLICVWVDDGTDVDEERAAKLQAQVLGDSFLRFIPEKFHGELGVILPGDKEFCGSHEGLVEIHSALLKHMESRTGGWENQAEVRITDGLSRMDRVLWFYDAADQLWCGWECAVACGFTAPWQVLRPEAPDYTAPEPKPASEFFPNPVFEEVTLKKYLEVVSSVFWAQESAKTVKGFAETVADTPYESYRGASEFAIFPTPTNKWGLVYTTISDRQLIWLPEENRVYTRGMRLSENFLETLEEMMGEATEREEPEWLNAALVLELVVGRPCITEYGTEPKKVDNTPFFAAIGREPFALFEGSFGDDPEDPGLADCYPIAAKYRRDQRAYEAWQVIQAATG